MRIWSAFASCVFLLIIFLFPAHCFAATLTIEPLRQFIELPPGVSVNRQLVVTNTTHTPETVTVYAETFKVINQKYDYSFNQDVDVSNWIQFGSTQAQIAPLTNYTFPYHVAVPNNAEPGGKYIAIFASMTPPTQNGQLAITSRAGSLIYLTVNGAITQIGHLIDFISPTITFNKINSWSSHIQNSGNDHFTSTFSLKTAFLSHHEYSHLSENHLVLPDTIRLIQGNYSLGNWPGPYKVIFKASLGNEPSITETHWVWYLPILPTLLLIILIALSLYVLIKCILFVIKKFK